MKNTHVTAGLDQQPTDLFPVTPTACGRVQGGLFVADVGQGDVVPGPEAHLDQPDTAGSCGQHQSVKMVGGFFKKCFKKSFKRVSKSVKERICSFNRTNDRKEEKKKRRTRCCRPCPSLCRTASSTTTWCPCVCRTWRQPVCC